MAPRCLQPHLFSHYEHFIKDNVKMKVFRGSFYCIENFIQIWSRITSLAIMLIKAKIFVLYCQFLGSNVDFNFGGTVPLLFRSYFFSTKPRGRC